MLAQRKGRLLWLLLATALAVAAVAWSAPLMRSQPRSLVHAAGDVLSQHIVALQAAIRSLAAERGLVFITMHGDSGAPNALGALREASDAALRSVRAGLHSSFGPGLGIVPTDRDIEDLRVLRAEADVLLSSSTAERDPAAATRWFRGTSRLVDELISLFPRLGVELSEQRPTARLGWEALRQSASLADLVGRERAIVAAALVASYPLSFQSRYALRRNQGEMRHRWEALRWMAELMETRDALRVEVARVGASAFGGLAATVRRVSDGKRATTAYPQDEEWYRAASAGVDAALGLGRMFALQVRGAG